MNFKTRNIILWAIIIILSGYIYIISFVSLIVWGICFLAGHLVFRNKQTRDHFIFSRSFIIITFIGILSVIDNYNYTGAFFGPGGDDHAFFNNILYLLRNSEILKKNIGFYEYVLAVPSRIISAFIRRDLSVIDILPVNWFLGAVICVLINHISKLLFDTELKFQVILLSLLLNFKFYDTIIHLYRDALLYVFFLFAFKAYLKKKYIRFSVFTFLTALLRGAHALLLLLFLFLLKIYDSKKIVFKTVILSMVFIFFMGIYKQYNLNIIPYMSQFQYIDKYSDRYEEYDIERLVEDRKSEFRIREGHQNPLRQKTYANDITGTIIGSFFQVFFPITFHFSGFDIIPSTFGTNYQSFTFVGFILWISIIAWIWIIPLLILGLTNCYQRKGNGFALILFYLISLLSVSMISMQDRHGLIFVIFHPVICQLGYNMTLENKRFRVRFKRYQFTVVLLLVAWNFFRIIM